MRMHAREELSRVGEYPARSAEPKRRHRPRRDSRQERHRKLAAAGRRAALLQRLRDAVLAGRHVRPLPALLRDGAPVAVVPVAHGGLPHFPGDDASPTSSRRCSPITRRRSFKDELTGSYRTWTYCVQYRETDLNFVSRLMEQEGIYYYFTHEDGKHTLVMADSYSAPRGVPGRADARSSRPRTSRAATSSTSARGSLAREIQPGVYVARRLRFRAAERRAADAEGGRPADTRRATTRCTTIPGDYLQKADGEAVRGGAHRGVRARSSRRRRAATNAQDHAGRAACSSWRTARARTRTASTWSSSATLRARVQRLRGDAGSPRARSTGAASRRCPSKQQFRPSG